MASQRPQPGHSNSWSLSTDALARLLAAKQAETDRRLAADLGSRRDQIAFQERLIAEMAAVTDIFELGRLILREAEAAFGAVHGMVGVVAESQFLEVVACTRAVLPRYQTELMEEAFIVGETLVIYGEENQSPSVGGSAEVPAGVRLTAVPLFQEDGLPLGVIVLEGDLRDDREHWLEGFFERTGTALADCQAYNRIEQLIVDAVMAIAGTHEDRNSPEAGHVSRVVELSAQLARALGLTKTQEKRVRLMALVHDLDAAAISEAFATIRRGKLTSEQWQSWLSDPTAGGIYQSPLTAFQRVVSELRCLRCRYDGKGNSPAVQGEQIPLAARIVAVAEAFENLTGGRAHRTTLGIADALGPIRRLAGSHYDPVVTDALCRVFARVELEARVARERREHEAG